jgi:hypothetical protein
MASVLSDLKARARILHRQVDLGESAAIQRLRRLPELADLGDATLRARVRRRHCLKAVAREMGFKGWSHCKSLFGDRKPAASSDVAKFIIGSGQIVARRRVDDSEPAEDVRETAQGVLARVQQGAPTVRVLLADGAEATISLGMPLTANAVEYLRARLASVSSQSGVTPDAVLESLSRRERWSNFNITVGEARDHYKLISRESADLTTFAGVYGAVGGSFGGAEMRKPVGERDLTLSAMRLDQFRAVAAEVVAAAPAFICSGRLTGSAAAFADMLAMCMLSRKVS